MNRRSRLLEALGVSTEWTLRGAAPIEAAPAEVAIAEPAAVAPAAVAREPAVANAEPGVARVADGSADAVSPRAEQIAAFDWAQLEAAVSGCTACKLCERRTQTVFGVGDRQAEWMLIGEAPGEQEDKQGEPFVGQAGKLLDSMLRAIGLSRETGVFIANVLKCRPPGNRDPEPDEVAMCDPYLKRQIALVKPRVIVVLGRFAAQSLLQTQTPVGKLRGKVHEVEGVPVVVTYHPAYLLRTLTDKSRAWEDLCLARKVYAEQGGR
ncbi:hypothetical protein LMG7141_01120 [Ralstonia condita]|uniref:Type-4 uracil-DNA glycosylase n=1 Tax=Ralstonia condita TaxID=3058600 RepID=A0ABM9J3D4_9RALS|nr:uracil-DNA glycosylase [Ralstonia sp. LMG 7141]CAJ0781224.1 hypothetical protein LMG7141_01120 [Ralstonia sp. LMG 7141]